MGDWGRARVTAPVSCFPAQRTLSRDSAPSMLRLPQATPTIDPRGGRPRPTLGAARGAAGHAARRYERVVHLVPAIIGVTAGACHRYWPADGRSRTTDQYPSSTPPSPPAVSQFPYLPLWTPLDGPEAALAAPPGCPASLAALRTRPRLTLCIITRLGRRKKSPWIPIYYWPMYLSIYLSLYK